MGVQESIIPAAGATMVPAQRRPSAYGSFTAIAARVNPVSNSGLTPWKTL
jgi:hypothetical protein